MTYNHNDSCTFDDQHIVSPEKKTESVSESDDPHKVPPDKNTECDFSIEASNKYQATSGTSTPLSNFP